MKCKKGRRPGMRATAWGREGGGPGRPPLQGKGPAPGAPPPKGTGPGREGLPLPAIGAGPGAPPRGRLERPGDRHGHRQRGQQHQKALLFITATNSTAGLASVQALVCGKYAVVFWVLFVAVGLVIPTVLETKMLFFSPKEFEESRKAHMISAGSDIGVLVGGFVLRLLVLLAALPVTMTVAWTL